MIGERLNELRKDLGLKQKEISEILFISYRSYCAYERDETEPNDETKAKLARFFNVSLDYLVGLTDTPHPIRQGDEYIRLPRALSDDSRKELKNYITFLLQKDKKNKRSD